ncbi:MAG: mechanosensitive ion channel family protein [Campylobacterota bacterium]
MQSIMLDWIVNIALAALIFFAGKLIARKLTDILIKMMRKAEVDTTITSFFNSVLYGAMLVFVVLAALSQLGIETTSFIAVLGAAGLAVGLAFKDSLSNIGAGMMIIAFKPFRVGDFVVVNGEMGTVEDLTIFQTFLTTVDNKAIVIPNANVIANNITNFSAKDTRRVDMTFGIGYDDDLKKAKEVLNQIVDGNEKILKDPAPVVAVAGLGESSVDFTVRAWVNRPDYLDVLWGVTEEVKLRFDQEGISIPFPQMDMHLKKQDLD